MVNRYLFLIIILRNELMWNWIKRIDYFNKCIPFNKQKTSNYIENFKNVKTLLSTLNILCIYILHAPIILRHIFVWTYVLHKQIAFFVFKYIILYSFFRSIIIFKNIFNLCVKIILIRFVLYSCCQTCIDKIKQR